MPAQPTAETPATRYTVRRDMPAEMLVHFRAWVRDAQHPDEPDDTAAPCAWCPSLADAERIAAGLNRDEMVRERLRFLIIDGVTGSIERAESG